MSRVTTYRYGGGTERPLAALSSHECLHPHATLDSRHEPSNNTDRASSTSISTAPRPSLRRSSRRASSKYELTHKHNEQENRHGLPPNKNYRQTFAFRALQFIRRRTTEISSTSRGPRGRGCLPQQLEPRRALLFGFALHIPRNETPALVSA